MNLKSFKVAAAAMVMVGMVFTGCGDDGETGPAGVNGNANVSSTTFTQLTADWKDPTGTSALRLDTLSVPAISQAVVNTGSVQVFQTFSQNTDSLVWNIMPHRYLAVNTSQTAITNMNLLASFNVGQVYLTAYSDDRLLVTIDDMFIKVVIIPSSAKVEGVDVNNYEELQAVYGIQEFDVK